MNKQQLQDLPWYSRVRRDGQDFNYYFPEGSNAVCFTDQGKEFKLSFDEEVIFLSSMKDHLLNR